jgi:hypothetical protein
MITETTAEMTAAGRDATEGATMRAELAQGLCQDTWRPYPHTYLHPHRDDTYRQHRCGREHGHRGACSCRYCGKDRNAD